MTSIATQVTLSVVGGILAGILIGGVGTAIFNATHTRAPYAVPQYTAEPDPDGDYSGLVDGEPGTPTAAVPLVCSGPCFDESAFEPAIMDDSAFLDAGLDGKYVILDYATTASVDHSQNLSMWRDSGNGPDPCFVTWAIAPIAEPEDGIVGPDPIEELAEAQAYGADLQQWVRLFPDTETATAYMTTLDAGLDGCPRYQDANGYPTDTVIREAAIELPESVAALGWVRKPTTDTRYYGMDQQRGNLVIRTTVFSTGGMDDLRWRDLMFTQAVQLAALPVP